MIVKDLIEQLKKFDPELHVLIANEEESIIGSDQLVKFFDITDIGTFHAETKRNDNGEVEFRFTGIATNSSRQFLNIDVTSQF
ncbi:hypothetical protein [Acinetobacter courvalinii]|uniref:hypothetical protein n=1 Tax=Acinetobacter courvalinii TaxID=280147 RepID=UPI0021D0FCD2|nr:hypothetical protein [Acinetobacter courvalinii]MCU4366949.1 hypothetical protein [Acinetobacter courvalinii]MCU4445154.1 hypothetical protein [Acinetobacter courvalinii]